MSAVQRTILWILARPMVAVLILLGLIGGAASAVMLVLPDHGPQASRASSTPYRVASEPLPPPAGSAPALQVKTVAIALRMVASECSAVSKSPGNPHALAGAVDRIGVFADRYPSAGFEIDDQVTSSLAVLIAVRQELLTCSPDLASRIESRIPAEYLGD